MGETVVRVDSRTGDSDWSRQLFGTVLGSPPVYSGFSVAFVTEAGKLYLLDDDGTGHGEWNLPSWPHAPPTADTDGIYVNCLDGKTCGISLENPPLLNVDWETETGWASGGLAVKHHLYAAGTRGIRAIDPESGERAWKHDKGDWR
ncbi:outer membrane protein assembly factor BamB family protein [Haladaptatus sp. NG-WS-4]